MSIDTRARLCLVAAAAAFALLAVAARAAANQPALARFTQADGLAGDEVTHVSQDGAGLLWIGTTTGLSRFDGRRFVTYDTRHGLPHPVVRQVLETSDGHLWVATDGGLARLEPQSDGGTARFRAWRFGSGPERRVSALFEDSSGRLWFGSHESVLQAREEEGRVRFWRLPLQVDLEALSARVLAIREGAGGDVWIGAYGGPIRILPDGRQRLYPSARLRSLQIDPEGTVWVSEGRHGVLAFRPEPVDSASDIDWAARYAAAEATPDPDCRVLAVGDLCLYSHPDPLPITWIRDIVPDGAGLWLAGAEGLVWFDGERFRPVGSGEAWLEDRFDTLLRDTHGSLWLGSRSRGLLRWGRSDIDNFHEAEGIRDNQAVQVLDTPRGELVAVTGSPDDYWLSVLSASDHFRPFRPRGLEAGWNGWGWNQWVVRDHRGEWWIPSEEDGIYRYPAVERVEDLATTEPLARYTTEDGLPGDRFFRAYEDGNGDLWFGILGTGSVAVWERASGRFLTFHPAEDELEVPSAPTAFAEDTEGRLWTGYYYGGVARAHDSRNRTFEYFGEADGVPAGFVNDLLLDTRGRMWIALTGAVLRVDDPGAPRPVFERLTAREGLSAEFGCCFAEDHFGRIYIGTRRGVDLHHPDTGRWVHLTTAQGLAGNLLRTMHVAADRAVWFGTEHGLSRLVPGPERASSPPLVRIEDVRVAGVPWSVPALGSAALAGPTLEPRQHGLTVGYFGIALEPGEVLRYQHRLVGWNDVWSVPTSETSVTFEALPAGRLTFEVRALRGDGTVSAAPATLAFERLPPIWQRGWFVAMSIALVALLAWGAMRLRDGSRRALERQRERIARDLHDQLGSGLGSIGIVAELLAEEAATRTDRHDAAAEIAAAARELGGSLSDIVWALDPQRLSLEELAARLAQRGTALLSGNQAELVCRFPESWPEAKPSAAVRRSVLLIGLEALHNAARHADPGRVELLFEPDSRRNRWRLRIRDDGCGLPFGVDRRRTASRRVAGERRRGRGLESMRRRAEEIGARIAWHPTPGGGTTVELDFPLHRAPRLPWRLT